MVLDCEAKDGIESTNSKPTLLEDQRKEREDIVMDERDLGFLPCYFVNPFDLWLLRCQLLVLYFASYNGNDSYADPMVGAG